MLKPIHVTWNKATVSAWTPHHERGQTYLTFDTDLKGMWDLYRTAEDRYAEREFLVHQHRRVTFKEFFSQVKRCVDVLETKFHVKPMDRVVMLGKNSIEWIVAYVAATYIGATAVPMNSWWTSTEIKYGLEDCGAVVVFADEERIKRIQVVADGLTCKVVDLSPAEFATLLGRETKSSSLASRPPPISVDEPAMIMYTSGTTAHPKGVVLTHRGVAHVLNIYEHGMKSMTAPRVNGRRGTGEPQAVILLAVPLFHATGMHGVLLASFVMGRKIVMMDKWNAEKALELVERERVTAFTGVPTMLLAMMASPDLAKRDVSSLKNVGGGGAPVPQGAAKQIKEKFKASPGQGYGLTECNAIATSSTGAAYLNRPGSCGRAVPGMEIQIWPDEEDDKPLPVGSTGRVMLRSASLLREYWKQPEATAKAITATGWFDSGDLGMLDSEGYLFIQDRMKDMIIRAGENISCRAVEEAVYAHVPGVMEASVVGIPHDLWGEEVCLALVMKDGHPLPKIDDVRVMVGGVLAQYQLPVAIVSFAKQLPRGATGKIVKRDIKTLIKEGKVKVYRVDVNDGSNNNARL